MQLSSSRARSAFTLIELLVVIAIIAILASILFPVFGRARENARRSSCSSNLKQVGLGLMQYSQDYDERMAPGETVNPNARWNQLLQPYIKSSQLFACPSNTANTTTAVAAQNGYPEIKRSYGLNQRLSGINIAQMESTATRLAVTEQVSGNRMIGWNDWGGANPQNFAGEGFAGHLSTMNVLFADGHVKSLKPASTITPLNMWGGFDTPAGGCTVGDINCEVPDPEALNGMNQLQAKYN